MLTYRIVVNDAGELKVLEPEDFEGRYLHQAMADKLLNMLIEDALDRRSKKEKDDASKG